MITIHKKQLKIVASLCFFGYNTLKIAGYNNDKKRQAKRAIVKLPI